MPVETDAVQDSVSREKRITEMKLERYKKEVEELEEKYEMNSDEFREKFESGELGDKEDFMKWDIYLDVIEDLEEKKQQLTGFGE